MARPNVAVPHKQVLATCTSLTPITAEFGLLSPVAQKALAELIMLRLFDGLVEGIAGVAYRLACNASYADGLMPGLLAPPARSFAAAKDLYETHGRTKRQATRWTKATFINETTRHVLDPQDNFGRACNSHALLLAEMTAVRNRIAHKNATSKRAFDRVVRRHYGGNPRSITPGLILLTPRLKPSLLDRYLAAAPIILRDCTRL